MTYEISELRQLLYYFQQEGRMLLTNMAVSQRLAVLIMGINKIEDYYRSGDNRKRKLPEWWYGDDRGLWRFFLLWEVTGALEYVQPKGSFVGPWLKISWKELCEWMGCTRQQLKTFLKCLEASGLIVRKNAWVPLIRTKMLWIRLRPFRLRELLQRTKRLKSFNESKFIKKPSRAPKKIRVRAGAIVVDEGASSGTIAAPGSEEAYRGFDSDPGNEETHRDIENPILLNLSCASDSVLSSSDGTKDIVTGVTDILFGNDNQDGASPVSDSAQIPEACALSPEALSLPASPAPPSAEAEVVGWPSETFRVRTRLKKCLLRTKSLSR
jgi:hypothetical protein